MADTRSLSDSEGYSQGRNDYIAKDFTWPPSAADELFVQVRHRVSSDEPCRVRVPLTRNGWEVSRSLAAIQTAGWSESK